MDRGQQLKECKLPTYLRSMHIASVVCRPHLLHGSSLRDSVYVLYQVDTALAAQVLSGAAVEGMLAYKSSVTIESCTFSNLWTKAV